MSLPFAAYEKDRSVVERWQRVVEQFPQQRAVTTVEGAQYTYLELDLASTRLANALLKVFGIPNHPVLLLLDHSYALLVGILGVIKANKAYVVLDPTLTAGQLQLIMQSAAAPLVVTADPLLSLARSITITEAIWSIDALPAATEHPQQLPMAGDTTAAILFTSGTTKHPKGVAYTHRMILHRAWFEHSVCHFGPHHRFAGLRPCGLGAGIADLFNALLTGSTYALYPIQQYGLQRLSTWLQEQQITYFHPPVILFRQWLETLIATDFFPELRYILPSGRKTQQDLVHLWPHVPDNCVVLTSYSSTETAMISLRTLDRWTPVACGVLDVGRPLPDTNVMILDSNGAPVAAGQGGEVVVRSRYIATGYWRQPELTAERFIPADDGSGETIYHTGDYGLLCSDGTLELVGRQDSQVKLRGYRVVLGEVEDALRALPDVKEAAVTADEERGLLYAYLMAATDPPTPPAAVRSALAATLPVYTLPTHIIYLHSFPLLPSGKIDHKALPALGQDQIEHADAYQAPQSELEHQLVNCWETLLQTHPIGVHDNFFERGGHSLLAMRLMVEIERQYGTTLPLTDFFRQPTITHLAHLLSEPATAAGAAATPQEDLFARLAATLSPQQVATVRTIYEQMGRPDQPQHWRKPGIERWPQRRKRIHDGGRLLPAPLSARLLTWLIATPYLRHRFFAAKEALIRRFLATIETPQQEEPAVAAALFCGTLHYYQLPIHYKATGGQVAQQTVAADLATGRGLILVRSHEIAAHYFQTLKLKSYRVGQIQNHIPDFQFDDAIVENALYTHQLDAARRMLQRGGIIDIFADGGHGYSNGLTVPFHNRHRPFWTSFAELAMMTDARVRLVTTTLPLVNGQLQRVLHIRLSEPLSITTSSQSHADRVADLVMQYVRHLQSTWCEMPWLVPWYQMQRHLAYPASI